MLYKIRVDHQGQFSRGSTLRLVAGDTVRVALDADQREIDEFIARAAERQLKPDWVSTNLTQEYSEYELVAVEVAS